MKKIALLILVLSLTLLVACTDTETNKESYTAEIVLKAFQDAGLATTDPRDNSKNCKELKCVSVITTEDVSIYEWETEQEAEKQGTGLNISDSHYSGRIYIRDNNDNLNFDEYKAVLDKVVSEK